MKHTGPISCVAAHGVRRVATTGYDNQVILWDAPTRTGVARAFHDHLANQCAFSDSGRWLVSSSSDYSARVWDVPSLRLRAVLGGHEDDVEMAMISPDETRVATCSRDRTVRIHSLAGAALATLRGHTDDVLSVGWSHDGKELVTSSDDGSVRRWNVDGAVETGRIDLGGVQTDTVVIARDGTVFAGDDSGRITAVSARGTRHVGAHAAGVKRLVFDEGSRRLVSLSYDRDMAVWQVGPDGGLTVRARERIRDVVWPRSAAFQGPDRLLFATFGAEYHGYSLETSEWDERAITPSRGVNAVAEHEGHRYAVGDSGTVWRDGLAWRELGSLCNFLQPFGPLLLTGGQLGILFDAVSGRSLHQHHSPLNCAATFVRDGVLHAATGAYTGEVLVFHRAGNDGLQHADTWPMHDNAVKGVAASDGLLFSVCASGAVAFHRLKDGTLVAFHARGHTRIANGCVAIKTGFASVGRDMKLRIWRGTQLADAIDTPHTNSIKCVGSNRDGTRIATGSYGGTTAIFDTLCSRWEGWQRPTASGISSFFGMTQGDHQFLASSYDGQIYGI